MFFYAKGNVKNVLKKESIKKIAQIVARKKIDKQIQNKKIKQEYKTTNFSNIPGDNQELFDLYIQKYIGSQPI